MDDQSQFSGGSMPPVVSNTQMPVNGLGTPPPLDDLTMSSTHQPSQPDPLSNNAQSTSAPSTDTLPSNLLEIRKQALSKLEPLVKNLDQSPEDRFKTTMMMIQASDNQDLIKVAYDAAERITDENARAQALLDVVNEINYFTQRSQAA